MSSAIQAAAAPSVPAVAPGAPTSWLDNIIPSTFNILGKDGLLSKAADTALEVWAIREMGKASVAPVTVTPPGPTQNPDIDATAAHDAARVKAAGGKTDAQAVAVQAARDYMPYIAGGAAIAALLVVVLIATRK